MLNCIASILEKVSEIYLLIYLFADYGMASQSLYLHT